MTRSASSFAKATADKEAKGDTGEDIDVPGAGDMTGTGDDAEDIGWAMAEAAGPAASRPTAARSR